MTAGDATKREPRPREKAVLLERARWRTPNTTDRTGTRHRRRVQGQVDTRGRRESPSAHGQLTKPSPFGDARSRSQVPFQLRANGAVATSRRAITTRSSARRPSAARALRSRCRKISRMRRLARLRVTAPPMRRDATMPSRSWPSAFGMREQRQRSRGDTAPMLLNRRELAARSQPRVGAVRQWHVSSPIAERGGAPRKDG